MKGKKTILTSGNLSDGFQNYIKEQYDDLQCIIANNQEEIAKLLPQADFIAGFNFLGDQKSENLAHIQWIHSFGAGVEGFLQQPLPEACKISKTKGKMGVRMAEYCLAYILNDIKFYKTFEQQQKQREWTQLAPPSLIHQSAILFGTGNVSKDIAQVLQPLLKNIIGVNSTGKNTEFFDLCLSIDNLESEKIEEGAIVINILPAVKATNEVFNEAFFSKLKNVLFINIGRGNAVNEADLLQALEKGNLRAAVLDVFKEEPLSKESPLWKHPKITITPHISGITRLRDVEMSFKTAYQEYLENKHSDLWVEKEKGY